MPYYNHTLFISSVDANDQTDIFTSTDGSNRVTLCQEFDEVTFNIDELQFIVDTARKMQKTVKAEAAKFIGGDRKMPLPHDWKDGGQVSLFEALDREDRF